MEPREYGMNTYLLRLVACLLLCVSLNSFGASTSTNLQLVSLEQTQFIYAADDEYLCNNHGLSHNTSIGGCINSSVIDYSDQNQFVNFDFQYGDNGFYTIIGDNLEWQPSSGQTPQINSLALDSQGLFSTLFDFNLFHLPYDFMFVDDFSVGMEDWSGSHELLINIDGDVILNFIAFEDFHNSDIIERTFSYNGSSMTVNSKTWDLYGNWTEMTYTFSASPVPLPAGIYLFLSGLIGLGWMRGRRSKQL